MSVRQYLSWRSASLLLALSVGSHAHAANFATSAANGAAWLTSQINQDGSWGATDEVKFVQTSEAVLALKAINRRSTAYYAGLSWLDNHAATNTDFTARRVLTVGAGGGSSALDITTLSGTQAISGPDNSGWGLSGFYNGSALDTGLVLQALNQQGVTTNVTVATAFLTSAQLTGTDTGWALGQEASSDPITTAQVLQALIPLQTSSTAVANSVASGLSALNAKVTSTSPVPQIAQAALANMAKSSTSTQATTLLTALTTQQASDGSWGEDPYATAMAVRALAIGQGLAASAQTQAVNMPDAALRAAVNAALGKGAMDAIDVGECQQLTALNAANAGIASLTGLQCATNLSSLNVANNNISTFSPIAGMNIPNLNEAGNPGYVAPASAPTLPPWGMVLLACLLAIMVSESQGVHTGRDSSPSI